MRTVMTFVALLGGVLLLAGPTAAIVHHPSPSPFRAETAPTYEDVVHVTGRLTFPEAGCGGGGTFGDYALEWRDLEVDGRLAADDRRLRGTLRLTWNCDVFKPDYVRETSGAVAAARAVLVNEEGWWRGTWRGLTFPKRAGLHHHLLLEGKGSYAGLSALLYLVEATDGRGLVVEGLIFPGELPPIPDAGPQ